MKSCYEIDIFVRHKDGDVIRKRKILVEDVLPSQVVEVWVDDVLKFEDEVEENEELVVRHYNQTVGG